MPLGHSETQVQVPGGAAQPVAVAVESTNDTVVFYGASDDLIEVTGEVEGCDEYPSSDAHFMVLGDGTQVRLRVWLTKKGVWAISASQAAEGQEILPVVINGGALGCSVVATVTGVRLVIREAD